MSRSVKTFIFTNADEPPPPSPGNIPERDTL